MIKKNVIILIIGVLFFLLSCSRESDVDSSSSAVTGKWTVAAFQVSNFENSGTTLDEWAGLTIRPTIELRTDGKSIDNLKNGNYREMTYSISGSKITFSQSLAYSHSPIFDYEISNGTMTLTSSNSYGSYTEYTKIILKK